MMSATPVEDLARLALDGDRDAVERLVGQLQGDIYGLALRMLWNREDAEDATQEILVRAVTRLAQFDFRSKLKTWVYRIAVNYILDVKKSAAERMHLTFAQFADDLAEGLSSAGPADTERSLLTEEVKIGCTLGMLQCLDRPHRLAYVLGEILDLAGPEAAEPWRSRLISSANGCSTPARQSSRLRARTVASRQTPPRAPATGACPQRCALDEFARRPWTSQANRRRIEKRVRMFAGLRRRDGRSRSIEPTDLAARPPISRAVWSMQSTPRRSLCPERIQNLSRSRDERRDAA